MVKVYVQQKRFQMVGKAKDIRAMLRIYRQYFRNVYEFTQKNHHTHMSMSVSSTNALRKINYYSVLFPKNKRL